MTPEQAKDLTERVMGRFPRGYRDAATMGAWVDELTRHDYRMAVDAMTPLVRSHPGEYPPPLNAIKDAILRAKATVELAKAKAQLPPPAGLNHRTTMARRARLVVDYLLEHGTGPMGNPKGKWVPHITPAEYHAARNAGVERPGSKRLHEVCADRYGYGWDDPQRWHDDGHGGVIAPNGEVHEGRER